MKVFIYNDLVFGDFSTGRDIWVAREGSFQADTQLGRGYGMYTVKPVLSGL